ncbi:2,3-diaminopropionate biosynthesis protein SbnA [Amycolatopsis sp. YIM 10]|uniref:2,3-diaminopropionate biosynthesis protein SbnA n=1 Tax=Amycolatopsis sp. YIM 10 TaxID=2653857 RepID=UPI0012A92DFF|nr:2,3-diaminopropionate biosynthesis protein SbnA [Amycolatopsis sp. YIM 10]QFU89752.1 putative siderophore biosynthesis protein SbnA [Amycolatopsis sp. YIM 10]
MMPPPPRPRARPPRREPGPAEVSAAPGRQGVLAAVGATPLVRLDRLFPGDPTRFYAKLEALNPGGSNKDRAALGMVLGAIESGQLIPGKSTVIESSSGNLGVGLAQVCRLYDLRFICVVDPKTTAQNLAILTAYGAELNTVTEADNELGDFLSARIDRVRELVREVPNAFWLNQYANTLNAVAQERVMGEIAEQLDGEIDYLFVATGTCGTIHGCARFIAENGLSTRVIAVDAEGSAIFGEVTCHRLIPGHGAAIRSALHYDGIADSVVRMTDQDCVVGCRRLVGAEAILSGGSSGAVVSAVSQLRAGFADDASCVMLLPDRGERYLDTIYSDAWVEEKFGDIRHLWKEQVAC